MIIRLGAMGDVVRTLPALQALRTTYPDAHISWLVEKGAAGVLRGHHGLDRVLVFPREDISHALLRGRIGESWSLVTEFVRTLRAERFDLVIDFHAILKSGAIAFLSGARTRVSYARPFSREFSLLFANHHAQLSPRKMSRYDRNAGLLRYLSVDSVPIPATNASTLTVDESARRRMELALGGSKDWVLIHPGSSRGADYKRYGPLGYANLARGLRRKTGLDVIVTLGTSDEERALAEKVVAGSRGAARLAPATPELADLIALIARARLFVGSDSGPLHLATSLGTPAVQIMGPTDPIENEPRKGANWKRVRMPVPCSPCRRGCAQATCMTIIPHELVLEAALACLAEATSAVPAKRMALSRSPSVPVAHSWI